MSPDGDLCFHAEPEGGGVWWAFQGLDPVRLSKPSEYRSGVLPLVPSASAR